MQNPTEFTATERWKEDCCWTWSHNLSVVIIESLQVFPQQLQYCLTCTEAPNTSQQNCQCLRLLLATTKCKTQHRKDTSSWNWKNIMTYYIYGCSLNSSSSQNWSIWMINDKEECRSKHTNKSPNHNISVTEITLDRLEYAFWLSLIMHCNSED